MSLSAHLDSLAPWSHRGTKANRHTVIGYAGDTGGRDIPVDRVQVHPAYYRCPHYDPDGSPYGAAGLEVVRHRYFGGDRCVYRFGWEAKRGIKAKGSRISY